MNADDLKIGSVVLSKQGRDKGMYFVVVNIDVKKGYVYLADGGMRKLNAPKKKNPKHISDSGTVLEAIAVKLNANKKVFDSEVKSALRQFNQQI
ncbi:MAG: KOW domain-containing RNA-binding protein [Corallococcus sp.]|nr:KOW domain-containing RNA-binding protein [Bacillota bacterium]MCM1533346.1 KOW domain-containing RNA-binding protein [Corallococcus sp.]